MNTEDRVHLFRGAPSVRSWSKYQKTAEEWTLCGIRRVARGQRQNAGRFNRRRLPGILPLLP